MGPWVVKLMKRVRYTSFVVKGTTYAAPTLLAWLTEHYPKMYAWLEPFASFLR